MSAVSSRMRFVRTAQLNGARASSDASDEARDDVMPTSTSMQATVRMVWCMARRDLRLSARRRTEAALPLAFFLAAAGLFPVGIGPEPQVLRQIGAGVVWVCALLAVLLGQASLFAADHQDGSLDQMQTAPWPLSALVAGKVLAHWLVSGLPVVLAAPLLGALFGLEPAAICALMVGLLLGTPVLAWLGAIGAALTLGLRSSGPLLFLLVLPLAVPVLIFGTGAVGAVLQGLSMRPHLQLLGALLLLTLLAAPPVTAAALRLSTE